MSLIKVLDKEIAELIAAGEVIERPSSVIKELVENSIDSGAAHITVEIKNGGITYMRVTDDGCGIAFDDVPTAFLRHATSKVATKDDLDNIMTLGFRGEALASVAAVSRAEVMTKLRDEEYGTIYKIEGIDELMHEKSGCPNGTTIIIRDIFFNVPARRKFLKKDIAEANSIAQILRRIAISHPEIGFKFIRDNKTEFNSSGDGELYSAVYAVFGREFVRDMLEVEYEYKGVKVSGYVLKPLYSKSSRSFQNFYVNGRYVKSKLCSKAIESAFSNMVMVGKFPACVLMIDVPPSSMDVNIHPAKSEVRFTDEKTVSDAVYFAVKNAMESGDLRYDMKLETEKKRIIDPWEYTKNAANNDEASVQSEFIFTPIDKIEETEAEINGNPLSRRDGVSEKNEFTADTDVSGDRASVGGIFNLKEPGLTYNDFREGKKKTAEKEWHYSDGGLEKTAPTDIAIHEEKKSCEPVNNETAPTEQKRSEWTDKPKIRVIGEVFGVYIIAETDDGTMVMIDKHAAHERVIFERLKSRNCRQYSQMLMNGVKLLVTAEELSALEANVDLLADMGFAFDFSERPCVKATAVPTFVMELDLEEIISEIAENLCMHSRLPQSHTLDDMLHTVACKSAIRGNDKNDIRELQALAEEVYSNDAIRHCPHGRPVMFTMTKSRIEHQFGRT